MFLKSLDIFGFKSFADKTHVEFADGITALLGPNGCGKSNVVDAVKWVLAENRAKNLRASTMESVIFNGTETRSPLNVAEVTLTISNEKNLLKFDAPEIAIRRRIYRSGENEYFINNRSCGPTEIRRLFLDTGVGKAAYSVMEQGKIDQILSSRPEDRRYLFEEAAGISRSKQEVAEAEKELERTRQNLSQIEIALGENKRTYEQLKIQSEKTKRYRVLKDEIFECELDIQLLRLKVANENQNHGNEKKAFVSENLSKVRQEIEAISEDVSLGNDKIKEFQTQMSNLQNEVVRIQAEKTGKLAMSKKLSLDLSRSKEKIGQIEVRSKAVEERIENLSEEIDEEDADTHQKTRSLQTVRENIASFEENIARSEEQIAENGKKNEKSSLLLLQKKEEKNALEKKRASITEDIVRALDARLRDSSFSAQSVSKAREEIESAIKKIHISAEGKLALFKDFSTLNLSALDAQKIVTEAVNSFEEMVLLSKTAEEAVKNYENALPHFISEFLSPEGIITQKREIDLKIDAILKLQEEIENAQEERKKENEALSATISDAKSTIMSLKVSEAQMAAQIEAAQKQTDLLRRQLAQEKTAKAQCDDEFFLEEKRRNELLEQIEEIQESLSEIEVRGSQCVEAMNALDKEIREKNSSMSGKQDELKKKQYEERKLSANLERLSLDIIQAESDIRHIKQMFLDQYSRDLSEFSERMSEIKKSPQEIRQQLEKAREEQRSLGQVNFMAVEEFAEIKERYEKLQASYDDTKKSLDDLLRISEEIRSKSSELFLSTYNKIRSNFHNMFRRLFGGGRGALKLTDPENVLTSGIDIFAQPPGKKLENIALLSGGEKTMTAVALLFATYQVRPSPFCLLDEIDAALDDKNVMSFVSALRSFSELSQYIVITHNKKTVLGAKTMLGVTMEESGVSKIITMRLDKNPNDFHSEEEDGKADDNTRTFSETTPFEEEQLDDEEGVFPIPRPPARIFNEDGTITDPVIEEKKRKERAEKEARQKVLETQMMTETKGGEHDGF